MGFDLIVLGSSGTYPTAATSSTGFLLRADGTNVWLDAGTGTFANLQRHVNFFDVRAVVLSHLHLDHILDLYPFYYGLRYSLDSPGPRGVEVYGPQGAQEFLSRLVPETADGAFDGYLKFETISAGDTLNLSSITFEFARSVHPIETLAMRIEAAGRVLAYTSDTGPADELIDFFKGANILIAEATQHEPRKELEEVHMTSSQAGELARVAGVDRLVLTHISPGLDPMKSIEHASEHFDGEVLLARDNARIEV